jgi:hypothetical protein
MTKTEVPGRAVIQRAVARSTPASIRRGRANARRLSQDFYMYFAARALRCAYESVTVQQRNVVKMALFAHVYSGKF